MFDGRFATRHCSNVNKRASGECTTTIATCKQIRAICKKLQISLYGNDLPTTVNGVGCHWLLASQCRLANQQRR